ncbi:MAG: hypothetical protein JXN10_07450 [Clostridia bacterium]|nr:hypothetical protein [Clostridia bacterium]
MKLINKRQLFIDNRFITESSNIDLVLHRPLKTHEMNVFSAGTSHVRIGGYSSVIYHNGRYMIWYGENDYRNNGIFICVRLAVSDDGITWVLPELGIAGEYKGKPNNVVLGYGAGGISGGLGDGTCMVFLDPNDGRFRMTARHGLHEPLGLYSSNDGINWEMELETVLDDGRFSDNKGVFHLDSQNVIFWDDRISKYVAYVRKNFEKHGQYRTIARGESRTLDGFPAVEDMPVVLSTDANDYQIDTPEGRQPASDFYTNATLKYPWAEDAYFMFPNIYFKYDTFLPEFEKDKPRNAGPIDIRFASGRDGISWNRHDRKPFVGIGGKEDFDSYSLYMLNGIVPGKGNDMYMYYMGTDLMHGWDRGDRYEERENHILTATGYAPANKISAISRLILRKDGFISVSADYRGGSFTTPLFTFEGSSLCLNVDTGAAGMVKVGLCDSTGIPVPRFSMEKCLTIHTCNDINKKVVWERGGDLSSLQGKAVRMEINLVDSDLYAFEFRR